VPHSVKELHAANNSIAVIRSEQINELDRLALSSNRLLNLCNLTNFSKLQFLDLSDNHFQNINFGDLKNVTMLRELKLSGNQLSEFEPSDIVSNLPKLKIIELSTKHWSADYVIKLEDDLKIHNIVLGRDSMDTSGNKIVTPAPGKSTSKPSSTTDTSNKGSDGSQLEEINRRLSDVEHKMELTDASKTKEINDRLNDIHKDIDDKMTKSNAANNVKYDAILSTLKTYEALVIIIFIVGLMFVLYKVVIHAKGMLNGMRYRRAQSHDPIFSEQDL